MTTDPEAAPQNFWFPGRWIGGVSLILAPLVLLTGVLLRIRFHFFFPEQLTAFRDHPALMTASYNCFVAGNILLWPAIITLAEWIGRKRSQLALWGGSLAVLGLFARTFHGGVDHLAFQLVRLQGLETATSTVADAYGAFSIVATLNGAIMAGWVLLGLGAYLSGTFGLFRSIALGSMSLLMLGVLKGSSWVSVIATAGLCAAFLPFGISVLKSGPTPRFKAIARWTLIVLAITALLYFFGQAG